jgi:tripartite ATP-independent transporter DctP family solute receptor
MKLHRSGAVVSTAALALALAACTSPESAASGPSSGDTYSLVIAHAGVTSEPVHAGAVKFAELVEEYSDGRITAEVFPDSQLGGAMDALEGLSLGTVHVTMVGGAEVADFCPAVGVYSLPYVLPGEGEAEQYDNLRRATDSDFNRELLDQCAAESDLRVIDNSWWYGNRHTTSNRAIETPEDFRGLTIRTPAAELHTAALAAFGAQIVSMAPVYSARETGAIDGQENPASKPIQASLFEVQSHLNLTAHMAQNQNVTMSESFFSSLSEADQEIIRRAVDEAGA